MLFVKPGHPFYWVHVWGMQVAAIVTKRSHRNPYDNRGPHCDGHRAAANTARMSRQDHNSKSCRVIVQMCGKYFWRSNIHGNICWCLWQRRISCLLPNVISQPAVWTSCWDTELTSELELHPRPRIWLWLSLCWQSHPSGQLLCVCWNLCLSLVRQKRSENPWGCFNYVNVDSDSKQAGRHWTRASYFLSIH